jgi:dephospho-CoA kinase
MVVGFAGRIGAGKTTAATYLKTCHGFQYLRYSQVLQEWNSPTDDDRARLQAAGWGIMAGGRQAELNSRLIARLDRSRSATIDGLRHVIDFESFSSELGASFSMVFLDARSEIRLTRSLARFSDAAAFQAADSHPVEGAIESLRPMAGRTICNDGSLEELYAELDGWINARRIEEQS